MGPRLGALDGNCGESACRCLWGGVFLTPRHGHEVWPRLRWNLEGDEFWLIWRVLPHICCNENGL